jgi:hypothetical protein
VLDWIERHVDLLVLFQFHHSAFVDDASKVQYAVVIEVMGLQRSSLLAPASEAGPALEEAIKGRLGLMRGRWKMLFQLVEFADHVSDSAERA